MLVFCLIYVKYNFAKHFLTYKTKCVIKQIWEVETKQKLTICMQSICTLHLELMFWINNKKKTWNLAGFAKRKSKVPYKWWAYVMDKLITEVSRLLELVTVVAKRAAEL